MVSGGPTHDSSVHVPTVGHEKDSPCSHTFCPAMVLIKEVTENVLLDCEQYDFDPRGVVLLYGTRPYLSYVL